MKKFFTLAAVAFAAMSVNAQDVRMFKWCVPEDFDMTEYHKIIEAVDVESGEKIGTIEMLSSPNKNDLFEELKDENGEKVLDEDGKPQFDTEHPKPAWSWKCNNPESNMSLSIWEEGFGYGIIGKGNPVMSQEEGWVEGDNGWSYKVENAVYWTPGCGSLPLQGEYIKVTATRDGQITIGAFINKGGGDSGHGHRLYIVDETTKDQGYLPIAPERITVKGTFQNNTWIPEEKKILFNEETQKWEEQIDPETGEDIKWYPFGDSPELPMTIPMTENYSIFEYTNQKGELTYFNRPFLGLISFDVKKDVTYWMFNPTSQLGFYGFKLEVSGEENGIATIAAESAGDKSFTLSGQQVSDGYRGLVIKNGKKVVMKN